MERSMFMGPFRTAVTVGIAALLFALIVSPTSAQTYTTLASVDGVGGSDPEYGPLAQGRDGNFYGTTYIETTPCAGLFKVTAAGSFTWLKCVGSFTGGQAYAGVILGTDGNLWGTTAVGGLYGWGTIYKYNPNSSAITTLYSFCTQASCADGVFPLSALLQASNGNFYGTTPSAGAVGSPGTIFEITSSGKFTTLYTFCAQTSCADGENPGGSLTQGTDGNLYGVTLSGGYGYGTIFRISLAGKLTTLYKFTNQNDGMSPIGALVQASDGNFYGATQLGGAGSCAYGCGTIFKMTPAGTLTTLHYFDFDDGGLPNGGLVQGTDGNLYGTTQGGGCGTSCPGFGGTVFAMASNGTFTSLHLFSGPPDGSTPLAPLIQSTNGRFYGETTWGGISTLCGSVGCGSVFSEDVGLSPFVQALTYSGKVGATIQFLGQGFTKSSTVSFNGTAGTPNVMSGTFLTVKVPSGATSGFVTITTSKGSLKSARIFRVTPQILSFAPPSGPVGTVVTITGVSLTQATRVTFGGKPASFTINSDTQVTATVPTGAKTGKIVVTTPAGTATSAGSFTVTTAK